MVWPVEMTALLRLFGAPQLLSVRISTLPRPQGAFVETRPQTPQTKPCPTHVLPLVFVNPEVNKECWGKSGAGRCLLRNAGNCSSDMFNEKRSPKKIGLENFRQDGETKLKKKNCTVSWALVPDLPLFRYSVISCRSEGGAKGRSAPEWRARPYPRWRLKSFRPGTALIG